ncbi:MAG: FKBP-type peptidyl-prolyl cis-trans isomerase [Bacteroidia bacterium]|nr:FKBP-type peptidyl-prolyl cis-trans isomerase [Bacteroidia bacterium]
MIKYLLFAAALAFAVPSMAQDKPAKGKKGPNEKSAKGQAKKESNTTKRNIKLNEEITTASGLKYKVTEMGSGRKVEIGDKVSVHYTGKLTNGTKFDSSKDRNQPFSFKVGGGQVIRGWDEGLALLHIGDKATLTIPSELGYGQRDMGTIPPNSTLIFDIEVLDAVTPIKAAPFDVKGKDTLTTASGLKYIIVKKGEGAKAENGKTVDVHYTGYLMDGRTFDSSVERGEPISFPLGQGMVIKGWEEGIALMHVGDKMRIIIPSELGYGANGAGGVIPPNATLIFDVELMNVK